MRARQTEVAGGGGGAGLDPKQWGEGVGLDLSGEQG